MLGSNSIKICDINVIDFRRFSSDSCKILIRFLSDSRQILIRFSSDSHQILIRFSSDSRQIFIRFSWDSCYLGTFLKPLLSAAICLGDWKPFQSCFTDAHAICSTDFFFANPKNIADKKSSFVGEKYIFTLWNQFFAGWIVLFVSEIFLGCTVNIEKQLKDAGFAFCFYRQIPLYVKAFLPSEGNFL